MAIWNFWKKKREPEENVEEELRVQRKRKAAQGIEPYSYEELKAYAEGGETTTAVKDKPDYGGGTTSYEELKAYAESGEKTEGKQADKNWEDFKQAVEEDKRAKQKAKEDRKRIEASQKASEAAARVGKSGEFQEWLKPTTSVGEIEAYTKAKEAELKREELMTKSAEAMSRSQMATAKAAEARSRQARVSEIAKYAERIGTLGGKQKPNKEMMKYYLPSHGQARQMHDVSGMRKLSMVDGRDSTMSEVVTPKLGGLKQMTMPGSGTSVRENAQKMMGPRPSLIPSQPTSQPGVSPIAQLARPVTNRSNQDVSFNASLARLRSLSLPPGVRKLGPTAQATYTEVQSAPMQAEPMQDVVQNLAEQGFSQKEIVSAINRLQRQKLLRKTKELGEGQTNLEVVQ